MDKRARLRAAAKTLRSDRQKRGEAVLYGSLAVNLAYALLQGINGVAVRSIWAGTLAFYYLTLSAIRFSLLLGHKKLRTEQKWKRYRNSACIMLALNFALLGIHFVYGARHRLSRIYDLRDGGLHLLRGDRGHTKRDRIPKV